MPHIPSQHDRRSFLSRVAGLALGSGIWSVSRAQEPQAKAAPPRPDLGVVAHMRGYRPFPATNPWNLDISKSRVDPNSDAIIASIGAGKPLHPDFFANYDGKGVYGMPYRVVGGNEPRVPIRFGYAEESDPGPYPIPLDTPVEGGPDGDGDRHVIVIDRDNLKLYELFRAFPDRAAGVWKAETGAIWDLKTNTDRPIGWTSADAAGLPIFPGLVRYDEFEHFGAIPHAIRFTCVKTRRAFVHPARHYASKRTDANLPPMGMRVRLKGNYDIAKFPPQAQIVLKALKTYGMILADNGGDWFMTGCPSPKWDDGQIETLKRVKGRDLEVVRMGRITTRV